MAQRAEGRQTRAGGFVGAVRRRPLLPWRCRSRVFLAETQREDAKNAEPGFNGLCVLCVFPLRLCEKPRLAEDLFGCRPNPPHGNSYPFTTFTSFGTGITNFSSPSVTFGCSAVSVIVVFELFSVTKYFTGSHVL